MCCVELEMIILRLQFLGMEEIVNSLLSPPSRPFQTSALMNHANRNNKKVLVHIRQLDNKRPQFVFLLIF